MLWSVSGTERSSNLMKDVNAQALIIENHVSSLTLIGLDGLIGWVILLALLVIGIIIIIVIVKIVLFVLPAAS